VPDGGAGLATAAGATVAGNATALRGLRSGMTGRRAPSPLAAAAAPAAASADGGRLVCQRVCVGEGEWV
jgi:hypothetical protein